MRDLISGEAELGDEEDDESYDEDTGEQRTRNSNAQFDDSSEEEEDDDDEEEARKVCGSNVVFSGMRLFLTHCSPDSRRIHRR